MWLEVCLWRLGQCLWSRCYSLFDIEGWFVRRHPQLDQCKHNVLRFQLTRTTSQKVWIVILQHIHGLAHVHLQFTLFIYHFL